VPETDDRGTTPLLPAVAGLVALDVLGGGIAVGSGTNTVRQAWSGEAVLAAPLPMIAVQLGLAAAADRYDDRRGSVAAGLLAAACLVSGASGFFDGQLGRAGLPRPIVGFQVALVGATVAVGSLALRRARGSGARVP
jgi:hypothetical protein